MNARAVALKCLNKIVIEKGYANLTLKNEMHEMDNKDKGFITEIVYGTLRNQDFLSFQWRNYVQKSLPKKIENILNMSVYQLYKMDKVPSYAIVNEAVDLSDKSYKPVVNAILHKCMDQGCIYPQSGSALENISIETSTPMWLLQLWKAHYGQENAIKICRSNLEAAQVIGRINLLKIDKETLERDPKIQFLDEIAFTYDDNLVQSSYFKRGEVLVQDYSSQQVAKYLRLEDNLDVLDCCSAPGTKTSQIAMYMHDTGHITAIDIHPHRVELIKELMGRLGINSVEAEVGDATTVDEVYKGKEFDRILVDAPCSGLGVLKRKPEIKYRVTPEELDSIVALQEQILQSIAKVLKVGGVFVYSTCTINKKENEKQIERFLKNHPNFSLLEQKTILPFEENSDGFYMASVVRNM